MEKLKAIFAWIERKTKQSIRQSGMTEAEKYLSQATSLEDLERRQRLMTYGKAPFQTGYSYYNDINRKGVAY